MGRVSRGEVWVKYTSVQALAGITSILGINLVFKGISLWVDSAQVLASVGEIYG